MCRVLRGEGGVVLVEGKEGFFNVIIDCVEDFFWWCY